jgi:hypothetical protein
MSLTWTWHQMKPHIYFTDVFFEVSVWFPSSSAPLVWDAPCIYLDQGKIASAKVKRWKKQCHSSAEETNGAISAETSHSTQWRSMEPCGCWCFLRPLGAGATPKTSKNCWKSRAFWVDVCRFVERAADLKKGKSIKSGPKAVRVPSLELLCSWHMRGHVQYKCVVSPACILCVHQQVSMPHSPVACSNQWWSFGFKLRKPPDGGSWNRNTPSYHPLS